MVCEGRHVSKKVLCHQSNVNRSVQFGVQKEEKLYLSEQFAN